MIFKKYFCVAKLLCRNSVLPWEMSKGELINENVSIQHTGM